VEADTVGIYSPSGSFSDTHEKLKLFEAGVERIRDHGFSVVESAHVRGGWYHASAPAPDRVSDLHALVRSPEVDVIIPSIGGHVATQMLPAINFEEIAESGVALFGFSDNSIIPLVTSALTGAITFHSLCDVTFGFGRFDGGAYELTERSLFCALTGEFDLRGTGSWTTIQDGTASGIVLGGNLRLVTELAGTPWWPDWRGKILFFETGDPIRAIYKDLTQLKNAGLFRDLAGLVIGRTSNWTDDFYQPDRVLPLDLFLLDVLDLRDKLPIVVNADIGHDVDNVTIPLGAGSTLVASAELIDWTIEDLAS